MSEPQIKPSEFVCSKCGQTFNRVMPTHTQYADSDDLCDGDIAARFTRADMERASEETHKIYKSIMPKRAGKMVVEALLGERAWPFEDL